MDLRERGRIAATEELRDRMDAMDERLRGGCDLKTGKKLSAGEVWILENQKTILRTLFCFVHWKGDG